MGSGDPRGRHQSAVIGEPSFRTILLLALNGPITMQHRQCRTATSEIGAASFSAWRLMSPRALWPIGSSACPSARVGVPVLSRRRDWSPVHGEDGRGAGRQAAEGELRLDNRAKSASLLGSPIGALDAISH